MADPMPGGAELDREFRRATGAGRRAAVREPRARAASFDPATGRLVELVNGAVFMVPAALLQGLAGASAEDLGEVQVGPGGGALPWEALDVELAMPGLLQGVFGTRAWMDRPGDRADGSVAATRGNKANDKPSPRSTVLSCT